MVKVLMQQQWFRRVSRQIHGEVRAYVLPLLQMTFHSMINLASVVELVEAGV